MWYGMKLKMIALSLSYLTYRDTFTILFLLSEFTLRILLTCLKECLFVPQMKFIKKKKGTKTKLRAHNKQINMKATNLKYIHSYCNIKTIQYIPCRFARRPRNALHCVESLFCHILYWRMVCSVLRRITLAPTSAYFGWSDYRAYSCCIVWQSRVCLSAGRKCKTHFIRV